MQYNYKAAFTVHLLVQNQVCSLDHCESDFLNSGRKLVIIVNKVLNMDIFLTKTHRFAFEGLY